MQLAPIKQKVAVEATFCFYTVRKWSDYLPPMRRMMAPTPTITGHATAVVSLEMYPSASKRKTSAKRSARSGKSARCPPRPLPCDENIIGNKIIIIKSDLFLLEYYRIEEGVDNGRGWG